jgi:hypothetical protein
MHVSVCSYICTCYQFRRSEWYVPSVSGFCLVVCGIHAYFTHTHTYTYVLQHVWHGLASVHMCVSKITVTITKITVTVTKITVTVTNITVAITKIAVTVTSAAAQSTVKTVLKTTRAHAYAAIYALIHVCPLK